MSSIDEVTSNFYSYYILIKGAFLIGATSAVGAAAGGAALALAVSVVLLCTNVHGNDLLVAAKRNQLLHHYDLVVSSPSESSILTSPVSQRSRRRSCFPSSCSYMKRQHKSVKI